MRFSLTPDQVALRDTVRELLAKRCQPAVVRAAWNDESAVDTLWGALVDLGLPGALVPDGGPVPGLGLDEVDLVSVLIETGYAAVPLPVVETVAVAAPLLAEAGDPSGHLEDLVAGRTRVALAQKGGLVPYPRRAQLVLVLEPGHARLVAPASVRDEATVDGSRPVGRVTLPPDEGLLTENAGLVALAADRFVLGTAAQLVGLARRMLDLTVSYVTTRRQFGVPVGSFQAVKHHLADALLRLEFAEPAVLAAAWAIAGRVDTRERDVSAAAVLAAEAAQTVARAAIQCHGAIGYTVEYDLHLYAKRAWALAAACDVDAHLTRLERSLHVG